MGLQHSVLPLSRSGQRHERNETLKDEGVNELGEEGAVTQRFWNGDEEDPDGIEHAAVLKHFQEQTVSFHTSALCAT